MPRVLVNVMSSEWSVHFIGPEQIRIGPWLLFDSHDEVRSLLRWGNPSDTDMEEHESGIRRWGCSSVAWNITNKQLAQLIERGKGWPWNGYQLVQMKRAGGEVPKSAKMSCF
jgi:hypothetical protein